VRLSIYFFSHQHVCNIFRSVLHPNDVGFNLLEFQAEEQERINQEQTKFADFSDEELEAFESQIAREKAEGAVLVEQYEKLRKAEEDTLLSQGEKVYGRVGSIFAKEEDRRMASIREEVKTDISSYLLEEVDQFINSKLLELDSDSNAKVMFS
jgi:flagellar motility protein MotE (MotC chaperone)